jgi:hypothetical protein
VSISGSTWCASGCGDQYLGACTSSVSRNDGYAGGQFIGSFNCPSSVSVDGTVVGFTMTFDSTISRPPE